MTAMTKVTESESRVGKRTKPGYWVICAVAASVAAALHFLYYRNVIGWMTDMQVYTEASRLNGEALYTQQVGPFDLLFQYPPFIADLFRVVSGVDVSVLGVVCNAASLLALNCVLLACLRRIGVPDRSAAVWAPLIMVVSPLLEPVDNCLKMGQVDIFLMALVVQDLTVFRRSRWQGVGIGIAAGIKLFPAVFVVYLLLTRRFRAAGTAIAAFAVVVVAGFITRPTESRYFWTHVGLGQPSGAESEQIFSRSTWSVLVRATGGDADLLPLRIVAQSIVALLVLVVLLSILRVWNLQRQVESPVQRERSRETVGFLGLLCLALAVPLLLRISWVHYWVWIVPMLVVCFRWAWLRRSAAGLVGTSMVLIVFTFRFHSWGIEPSQDGTSLTWLEKVQTGLFPVATIALLLVVARRLTARGAEGSGTGSGVGTHFRSSPPCLAWMCGE